MVEDVANIRADSWYRHPGITKVHGLHIPWQELGRWDDLRNLSSQRWCSVPPSIWPPLQSPRRWRWREWRTHHRKLRLRVIHGTAPVGEIVLKNVEQVATVRRGRWNVLPGTGLLNLRHDGGLKQKKSQHDTATNSAWSLRCCRTWVDRWVSGWVGWYMYCCCCAAVVLRNVVGAGRWWVLLVLVLYWCCGVPRAKHTAAHQRIFLIRCCCTYCCAAHGEWVGGWIDGWVCG